MQDDADDFAMPAALPEHEPELELEGVPDELARALRSIAPQAVQRITMQIQLEVTAYAGPFGGKRHRLVSITIDRAVGYFLDSLERKPVSAAPVYNLVRQLGQAEAVDGRTIDALRAAHYVASRAAWEEIRKVSRLHDLDPTSVAPLVDALFAFVARLIDQAGLGHAAARSPDGGSPVSRHLLLKAMLSGKPPENYAHHMIAAHWEPPNDIAVVTAILTPGADYSLLPMSSRTALIVINRSRLTLVAAPAQAAELGQHLADIAGVQAVATSWAVPLAEFRDAYRWTYRALDLSARGIINQQGVIECASYRAILWLHADPALAKLASEELLEPLVGLKPYYRVLLAETMLIWLQVRESAPVLADRMQVHEQTVRRRIKQLKTLFGNQLSNPHQTLALLGALEVILPRWREEVQLRPPRRGQP